MIVKKVTEFFDNELCEYSCYSTLRMIASGIDGLKNAQRKIIYTALEKNLKSDTKVSVFDNMVQSYTQYLHGSCAEVIQNMTSDYCGSNNLPLLKGVGNFGTRFVNEASAPRYVYSKLQEYTKEIFDITDVLVDQYFEGEKIEPKYFVPSIPMILVNGSMSCIASGFKQHILPYKLSDITDYIVNKQKKMIPFIKGYKGKVYKGQQDNQWVFEGIIEINKNKGHITEIPPFITYQKYLDILDTLVDEKKIKSYKDNSDTKTEIYDFEIVFNENITEQKALELLKLQRKEFEIYNIIDENNQVKTCSSVYEILDYYIDVRERYLNLQKEYDLNKLTNELSINESKYKFVSLIIDDKLKVFKRQKNDIINDLSKTDLLVLDNYEYLLKMPIHSFSSETLEKLREQAESTKKELEDLKQTNVVDKWHLMLNNFKEKLI